MLEDELKGRVAVVTGGSRGIGRSIAEVLSERGAAVGIAYRDRADQGDAVAAAITAKGGRAVAAACDVSDAAAVSVFFDRIAAELGPVDILVNNAGVARDTHVLMMDHARWESVLAVNLDGAFHCVRAVVRGMLLRRWGRIVNVSSPSATMPLPGQASYAASKAGLEGFTRGLSRDLAAKGVLVNAVAPGMIETDMLESDAGGRARGVRESGGARPRRPAARSGRGRRLSGVRAIELHHRPGDCRGRRPALTPTD